MILTYDADTDTLTLVLSDTHAPERCETLDLIPQVSVQLTYPQEKPGGGFKLNTDPQTYKRNNAMLHRVVIKDATLHTTGEHPLDLCLLFRHLHDFLGDLEQLGHAWRNGGETARQGIDLQEVIDRYAGRINYVK